MTHDRWREELLAFRKEKDDAFRRAEWSPIPPEERPGFRGLAYFDPDPRYRFESPLRPTAPDVVEVPLSTGGVRVYRVAGSFEIALPDGPAVVAAYAREGHDHRELFLPFRDATSERETYGAGRYLEAHRVRDDRYLVDFNYAYHPFCAYNDDYACPLPPRENWIQARVRAGERLR